MLVSFLVRLRPDALADGDVMGVLEEVDTGATVVFHNGGDLLRYLRLGVDAAQREAGAPITDLTPELPTQH